VVRVDRDGLARFGGFETPQFLEAAGGWFRA
jgi:hypothetical protein